MAGKFINKTQNVMLDTLVDGFKKFMDNPYYIYTDKKGSTCTYYNINTTKTTLDEATRDNYSDLGTNSPIRFNKIYDTILYGIEKILIEYDLGDTGIEAGEISGEALVLPNTFIPYPGDYFMINQLKNKWLFRVTGVQQNTIDTGAVLYKISYTLAYTDKDQGIDKQVVEEYNMMINNVGTNFSAVIKSSKYKLIEALEKYTIELKDYYNDLFYDDRVQSYTYLHETGNFKVYDAFLIEFLIRNKVIKGSTKYVYLTQQLELPQSFGIDYNNTIFRTIEDRDIDNHKNRFVGNLYMVQQRTSLLYAYPDDYYYMEYNSLNSNLYPIQVFPLDILDIIRNNNKTTNVLLDIMIKYFNDENITMDDLNGMKNIDYYNNMELYYYIPIAIYCIESTISNILAPGHTN